MLNKAVFKYLTNDEKTALSLQIGLDKSTWESGEIMGKSHYKYLEIKYRAEYFVKFFSSYIRLYDRLVPEDDMFDAEHPVRIYFRMCIEERKKVITAFESMKIYIKSAPEIPTGVKANIHRLTKAQLNEKIIKLVKHWETSDNAYHKSFLTLIKEFDRWNNFRILPKELQEPSAFKRRVKKTYKKHLEVITLMNEITLRFIRKKYKASSQDEVMYFPCMGGVVPLKKQPFLIKQLTSVGLYLFDEYDWANDYLQNLKDYLSVPNKSCKDGLVFWPKYREQIRRAFNYMEINNINPDRKYLRMAINKQEFFNHY